MSSLPLTIHPLQPLRIEATPSPRRFVEVTGRRIALLGREDGVFECWMWPLCLFDQFQLAFRVDGQAIEGRALVSKVVVEPHALELVYRHAAFTVRQVLFAASDAPALTCVLHLEAGGPVTVEARLAPAMRAQWPAGLGGAIAARDAETNALILTEELGRFAALVGSKNAAPIEVHADHGLTREPISFSIPLLPGALPAVFVVAGVQVEPEPLSDAARLGEADAARGFSRAEVAVALARSLWLETIRDWRYPLEDVRSRWRSWLHEVAEPVLLPTLQLHRHLRRSTPAAARSSLFPPAEPIPGASRSLWLDPSGDRAKGPLAEWLRNGFRVDRVTTACDWAKVAIRRAWVDVEGVGQGLVAGLAPSDGTSRPGFGWIFDGDAMTAARALTACGDFTSVRTILRLAAGRQRDDGKLMHELVLSAGLCRWTEDYPYAFYKAGNTPALVAVLDHYVETSGDLALARELLPHVRKAIEWCARSCDEHGLLANSKAGIAAVEAGPLVGKIQSEAYLNGIWLSALAGGQRIANALDDRDLADRCAKLLARAREGFELLWSEQDDRYGFALLRDGTRCDDLNAYVAHPMSRDHGKPERIRSTVAQLNHPALVADWGARMFSTRSSVYDPKSYNTGAVFPYLTNFVCLALYEHGDPMAGRQVLEGLLALHGFSGLGFVPEHLRGDRAIAPDRGVPHQIFSSAAVLQSVIHGAWGVRCTQGRNVRVAPTLHHEADHGALVIPVGKARLLTLWAFDPQAGRLEIHAHCLRESKHAVGLSLEPRFARGTIVHRIVSDAHGASSPATPQLELAPDETWSGAWHVSPGPSARFGGTGVREGEPSRDLRLLRTLQEDGRLTWTVAGLPSTAHALPFHRGRASAVRGAEWSDDARTLRVELPPGGDYVEHEIEFELE